MASRMSSMASPFTGLNESVIGFRLANCVMRGTAFRMRCREAATCDAVIAPRVVVDVDNDENHAGGVDD
ncbi:hypothetical protein MCEMSEM18_03460 [Comamonadaceae bacterium]